MAVMQSHATGLGSLRVLLVALLLLTAPAAVSVQPASSITELLTAYSSGAVEEVRRALAARLDSPAEVESFKRELDRPIGRALPVPAAAFALEATAAAIIDGVQQPDLHTQSMILDLLEIGCRKLRSSTAAPPVFEREWHLAAMALLSGPGSVLLGGVERPVAQAHGTVWLHPHTLDAHARKRFLQDAEIAFSWAVSRELEVHVFQHSAGVGQQKPSTTVPARERQQQQFLRDAALGFEQARQDERLRPEATLRLGRVRAFQGRPEDALRLWSEVVVMTADTSLEYLALLFRGMTLAELKSWPEAAREFQKASELRPGAQSARLATATFDYLANRHDEAARQVVILFGSEPAAEDPWSNYLAPGYRHWPTRLQAIRAAARPRASN